MPSIRSSGIEADSGKRQWPDAVEEWLRKQTTVIVVLGPAAMPLTATALVRRDVPLCWHAARPDHIVAVASRTLPKCYALGHAEG